MAIVVAHFEFKTGTRIGMSGPGDTLRLIHAVRYAQFFGGHRLLWFCPQEMEADVAQFLPDSDIRFVHVGCSADWRGKATGAVRPDVLSEILDSDLIRDEQIGPVVHAFIGREYGKPVVPRPCLLRRGTVRRLRIDSSDPERTCMFHGRWKLQGSVSCERPTLGVFIRSEVTHPERNAPSWFPQAVRQICSNLCWQIVWLGGKDAAPDPVRPLQGTERCYCYAGTSLNDQMRSISGLVRAAVGWNSGGLDLAAAAGVPVLRLGEHQRLTNWGKSYNAYLSVRPNIGIEPIDPDDSESFSCPVFERSLHRFLETLAELPSEGHYLLKEERPYESPQQLPQPTWHKDRARPFDEW